MRKYMLFVFLMTFPLSIYSLQRFHESPSWVESAARVRGEVATLLTKRHGLELIGVGGKMPNNVEGLSLDFLADHELAQEEARELTVLCMEQFLALVNSDEEIRPFLSTYPFSPSQIRIGITSPCRAVTAQKIPYLSIVWTFHGDICYGYDDADSETKRFREVIREPYDQARAVVLGGGNQA